MALFGTIALIINKITALSIFIVYMRITVAASVVLIVSQVLQILITDFKGCVLEYSALGGIPDTKQTINVYVQHAVELILLLLCGSGNITLIKDVIADIEKYIKRSLKTLENPIASGQTLNDAELYRL